MPTQIDIVRDTPYIPENILTADGREYAYSVGTQLKRIAIDGTITAGAYEFDTNSSPEAYATSTPGKVLVCHINASDYGFIYLTEDYGETFTKVLDLGVIGETQFPSVRVMQKGICEANVGGQTHYFVAEYNINQSRTNGGANDAVRIMRSTDGGYTWEKVAEWNTDGTRYIKHFHVITQDPYSKKIFICSGDTDTESAIIEWDPLVGVWGDNLTFAEIDALEGFRVKYGAQRYRAVDLVFTERNVHYISDTEVSGETGIWRLGKASWEATRRNYDVESIPNHCGWAGCKTHLGNIIFTDCVASGVAANGDFQITIWSSDNDGITYIPVAKFTSWASTDQVPSFLRIAQIGERIFLGSNHGAGKNTWDTAVVTDTGLYYDGGTPVSVHPVFFVGPSGVDENTGSIGRTPNAPWLTPLFALTSNRITFGSRVVFLEGEYSIPSINTSWSTHGKPGTGPVFLDGDGKDKSIISGNTSVSSYVLNFAQNDSVCVIKNLWIRSKKTDAANTIIFSGSNDSSGVDVRFEAGSKLGDPNFDCLTNLAKTFDALRFFRAEVAGHRRLLFVTGKAACKILFNASLVRGGTTHIYVKHGSADIQTLSSLMYDYTSSSIWLTTGATIPPKAKNTIFYSESATYDIRDSVGVTETDADIDYNCYSNVNLNLANSGGSHSITSDPLFVDAASGDFRLQKESDCIDAGVDVGLVSDYAGNPTPALAGYDIGPFEYRADYAPGYGPWSTCDTSLPTDGQVFKSHTAPIAAKKLTVFSGVASAAQIAEASDE